MTTGEPEISENTDEVVATVECSSAEAPPHPIPPPEGEGTNGSAIEEGIGESPRRWGWLEMAFLAVMVAALCLRLFELSGRTMHYDEAIHLHYGWKLANSAGGLLGWPWIFGTDYIHSAWMHGPFQIEMTAVIFTIFGDTDFTSRMGYALFGTALVGLPYFLREHIGRHGALIAAVMLTLSPALLYFSRFGRNDIIMMFWAVALLILLWRYLHSGRRLNLYVASALLALMFATKETAYLLVAIFGFIVFLAALPELRAWLSGRAALSREGTPVALLLLLTTLTLPQWSAAIALFQGLMGLTLANPDPLTGNNVANAGGAAGMTGAPAWQGGALLLPVANVPWIVHGLVVVAGFSFLLWLLSRGPLNPERVAGLIGAPMMSAFAFAWLLFRPYSDVDPANSLLLATDWAIFLAALLATAGCLFWSRFSLGRAALMALAPAAAAVLYSVLLTPVLNVQGLIDGVLPGSMSIGAIGDGVPANYVVALLTLVGTLVISAAVGIWWLGRAWLICSGVFYLIWTALYTTMFTNLSGVFTGFWQGMGYWIAQQDVARGNQPWYYYFVGLPVYELLPLVFGIAGLVYFFRRQDVTGLALALWAVLSLAAYTVASEKMPWLLVNITTPFILLTAKYLGEVSGLVDWRDIVQRGGGFMAAALLGLAPLIAVAAVFLFRQYIDPAMPFTLEHWLLLASTIAAAFVAAFIFRLSGAHRAAPAAALGLALLLLVFGTWGAFRAAYTYDDSNVEVMVFAQGSADVKETYQTLQREAYPAVSEGRQPVKVDYHVRYPLHWYVRNDEREGRLGFRCFETAREEGSDCIVLEGSLEDDGTYDFGNLAGLVVKDNHIGEDGDVLERYRRQGPFKELLWFPETYRRPDEKIGGTGRRDDPMLSQIAKDFRFFADTASSREGWAGVLNYVLFRNLQAEWSDTQYYNYLP